MKDSEHTDLNLLLSYADERAPVLADGLPHDAAADERPEGDDLAGLSFYDLGAAGNDVGAQGWGVIAPEGKRGDELLARIRPLIDARGEMQDEPIRIYRVPARMTTEQALRWRQDVYNNDEPDKIPRYQLFLGDLHEVPLELQQVQGPEGFVGRLAFSDAEGYDAYVDKVLHWQRNPSAVADPRALFYSVHDGTAATRVGHRGLIEPVVDLARAMQAEGRFQASAVDSIGRHDDPSPDELLTAAADLEAGVLFTMSHGEGAPRKGWSSARAQLNGQGAMCYGPAGSLPGREIAGKVFAPGGIWFMFACFGAGTPTRSKFYHWLSSLAAAGQFRGRPDAVLASLPKGDQRPFIAALPQAALASPDGPLAFVGHLDLAWTYSFMEIDQGKQQGRPGKYYNVLKSLCRGDRVGVALQELERFYNDKNQELTDLYDLSEEARQTGGVDPLDRAKIGHLWMVRQDLSGYILLGDPAVQLPLTKRAKKPRTRVEHATLDVRSPDPSAADASQAAPAAAAAPPAREPDPPASFAAAHDDTPPAAQPPHDPDPIVTDHDTPPAAQPPAPQAPHDPDPIAATQAPPDPDPVPPPSEASAPAPASQAIAAQEPEAARPPAPAAAAAPRSGEVAGEVAIDGEGGATIRWRIRWRLG